MIVSVLWHLRKFSELKVETWTCCSLCWIFRKRTSMNFAILRRFSKKKFAIFDKNFLNMLENNKLHYFFFQNKHYTQILVDLLHFNCQNNSVCRCCSRG